MAQRIRLHAWAATPLGEIGSWSASMKTALGILLTAPQPALLFWGPNHACFYNDAYAAMLGPEKHPAVLGMPGGLAWPEAWQVVRPILEQVLGGSPVSLEDEPLVGVRHANREPVHLACSYCPVEDPEAANGAGGVLVLCTETAQLVARRRAEERPAAALRAGRLGIHDFDPRTGVIQWDATAARLWGTGPDEVVTYEQFVSGLHPDDLPRVQALVSRALDPAGEGRYEAEYRVVNRTDGSVRWVHADGDVVFENGEAVRLVGTLQDVTERKEAEERLRRSSETFYRLIRDNPFGVYIVDAEFKLREVSRGAEKVFENVHPLLGRDFAEVLRSIWTEPFAGEAIERFRRTLATGEPYVAASTVEQRQDIEESQAYDWRIERVALPSGRDGVVCYFYDLSERRRLEDALRENADRLKLALDAAELGTWDLDLDSDTAVRSLRHDRMFGYAELQPAWGQAIAERHVLDEDKPIFRDAFARALNTGMLSFEARVRWPDGSVHWIAPFGRTYYDESGRAVRMAGVVADLTKRKHAEESLQASERQLRFALDAARAGTWSWDAQSNASSWDARYGELYGFNPGQPPGFELWLERVHPEDRELLLSRLEVMRSTPGDDAWRMEFRVLHPGGERWMLGLGEAERDADGRLIRMTGINLDVTERKQAEAARQLLVRELNHRVKNLFSVMDALVYMTTETTRSRGEIAEALRGRLLALARAHELILPAVTGEPGAASEGDLRDLVDAVLGPHLQDGSERIQVYGPRLPISARAATSMALVLHELATNAAKYGALSSPQGRIEAHWQLDGKRMVLTWEEQGGPAVAGPPHHRGFGSMLTRSSIEAQLQGSIAYDWAESGLRIKAAIPLKNLLP